jgi:GNAT superfamily N-acetyltransferase
MVAPAVKKETAAALAARKKALLGREWLTAVRHTPVQKADPQGWYQQALTTNGVTAGPTIVQLAETNLSPGERAELTAFASPARVAPTWSVMVKADQQVVTHAGVLYRVIQVGDTRVPVGALTGVMTLADWRGRGYARAVLTKAVAFVAVWLWAPFALTICLPQDAAFYKKIGWHAVNKDVPIWCDQPGGRVALAEEVAMYLSCQGEATWPKGEIDLCGAPW